MNSYLSTLTSTLKQTNSNSQGTIKDKITLPPNAASYLSPVPSQPMQYISTYNTVSYPIFTIQ